MMPCLAWFSISRTAPRAFLMSSTLISGIVMSAMEMEMPATVANR